MQKFSGRRWPRRQTVCLVLAAGVLMVAALVWFFPARWAMPWIAPRLHGLRLQQVHGLLWHGRADQVHTATGELLGRIDWQVSRRALIGPVALHVDFDGPKLAFAGHMQTGPGDRVQWEKVTLRADLSLWQPPQPLALGQPGGEWQMTVSHALLQGGWPLQLDMRARWRNAALHTPAGNVTLGELDWRASANDGVIDLWVNDVDGGPLQVAGTLRVSPLGWRLDARLRARGPDPALHRWLAALGTASADGTVQVHRSGGLASPALAAPAPAATTYSSALGHPGST